MLQEYGFHQVELSNGTFGDSLRDITLYKLSLTRSSFLKKTQEVYQRPEMYLT